MLPPELQRLAAELGIPGPARMRKGDLVAAISARQVGADAPAGNGSTDVARGVAATSAPLEAPISGGANGGPVTAPVSEDDRGTDATTHASTDASTDVTADSRVT